MRKKLSIFFLLCMITGSTQAGAVTVSKNYEFRNVYNVDLSQTETINILKDKINASPEDYKLHFSLAVLYATYKSDFSNATKEFKKTVQIKPDHYLSYLNLGYMIMGINNNNIEEAIGYFKLALKYEQKEPAIYNALAAAFLLQNKVDLAKEVLEDGIRKCKADESLYFNQALILSKYYQGKKEYEDVERNLKAAIALDPKEEYYFTLGMFYLDKKLNNEARSFFKKAIVLNPRNVYYILGLSTTYINSKDFEKAIEIAKEALLLEPDNKDVKDEIAEYEEAFEKWKKKKINESKRNL